MTTSNLNAECLLCFLPPCFCHGRIHVFDRSGTRRKPAVSNRHRHAPSGGRSASVKSSNLLFQPFLSLDKHLHLTFLIASLTDSSQALVHARRKATRERDGRTTDDGRVLGDFEERRVCDGDLDDGLVSLDRVWGLRWRPSWGPWCVVL